MCVHAMIMWKSVLSFYSGSREPTRVTRVALQTLLLADHFTGPGVSFSTFNNVHNYHHCWVLPSRHSNIAAKSGVVIPRSD